MDKNRLSNIHSDQETNRFLSDNRRNGAQSFSKRSRCTQFSEIDIDSDAFVLDVLQFFFDERLEASQLNDDLRDIAAQALWRATDGSQAMDMVPRPPQGVASLTWLVSQAVQIGFRRAQNRCIYELIRVGTKSGLIRDYQTARDRLMAQSLQSVDGGVASRYLSPQGLAMLKQFEGFRSNLYNDAAGHCTIGYGHLVHRGNCDGSESAELRAGIGEQRAEALLLQRVHTFEQAITAAVTVPLNQQQYDALVSFTFNVGVPAFRDSTLLRRLNAGAYNEVPTELNRWVNANGRPLQGLVRRREAEGRLFRDGVYPARTSGSQSLAINLSNFEAPYVRDFQAQVDWCQIRHSIIRSAVEVQGDWLASGNNLRNENDPAVFDMLVMFWRDGVGVSQQQAEATAQLSAQDHPTQAFWSAAFISWCVRNALPNPPPPHNGGFHFHMRHMVYIAQSCRNRENADMTRPFWLFDINDPNVVPEAGDILCLNRGTANGWTQHSYASVRQGWVVNNPNAEATGSAHCDIVISSEHGRVETIGGNVSDTVGSRHYSLDGNGRLVDQTQFNGTPIANRRNVTQAAGSRPSVVFALIRLQACTDFEN